MTTLAAEEPHDYNQYQFPIAAYLAHCVELFIKENPHVQVHVLLVNVDEFRHMIVEEALARSRPDLWR